MRAAERRTIVAATDSPQAARRSMLTPRMVARSRNRLKPSPHRRYRTTGVERLETRRLLDGAASDFIGPVPPPINRTNDDFAVESLPKAGGLDPFSASNQWVHLSKSDGTTRVVSIEESLAMTEQLQEYDGSLTVQGHAGLDDVIEAIAELNHSPDPLQPAPLQPEPLIFGGRDDRIRVTNQTSVPWRGIGRMWLGFGGGGEASCSGAMIGPYQFLTAAHCLYLYTDSYTGWVDDVRISLAQGGDKIPDDDGGIETDDSNRRSTYQPYGEADWTDMWVYPGWTTAKNYNVDIGIVYLDRNIGSFTTWFDWGSEPNSYYSGRTMIAAGYPGSNNRDSTPNQHDLWYDSGNPISYQILTEQLRNNTIDWTKGQSGGPLFDCGSSCTSSRKIHGVISHSRDDVFGDPLFGSAARISANKFPTILSRYNDPDIPPPADKPDLVDHDFWFKSHYSSLSTDNIVAGESLSISARIRNNGTGSSGFFNVSFYASTNETITTFDTFLGEVITSVSPFESNYVTLDVSSFPDLAEREYTIGWIIDSDDQADEYVEAYGNTGFVRSSKLQVFKPLPDTMTSAEGYAFFFPATAGDRINDTTSFPTRIDVAPDTDSFYFVSDVSGTFTIDLGNAGGPIDPVLAVYRADTGQQLGWDDNSGDDSDDARLTLTLERWTRYIVAMADREDDSVGEFVLQITAPGQSSVSAATVDPVTGRSAGRGTIDQPEDVDHFVFVAPPTATGTVSFEVKPAVANAFDVVLVVWEADTGALIEHRDFDLLEGAERLTLDNVLPGDRYVMSVFTEDFAESGEFDGLVEFSVNNPPTDITLSNDNINENTDTSAGPLTIGTLTGSDPDPNETLTFEFVAGDGDGDNDSFEIVGDQLRLKQGTPINYETKTHFSVRVGVTDTGGLSFSKRLVVAINDLIEVSAMKVGDGTAQRSRIDKLSITFDRLVDFDSEAFQLERLGENGGLVQVAVSASSLLNLVFAELTFSGEHVDSEGYLRDGRYRLTIDGSKVRDGNDLLDGNRDGIAGGNYVFGDSDGLFSLFGDSDGDGDVDALDYVRFASSFLQKLGEPNFDADFDFDRDDDVDALDYSLFGQNFLKTI